MSRRASAHARAREREHVLAAKQDLAGGRFDQPQDAAAGRALAAAGFADESEHLAFVDREAHIVHGLDDRRRARRGPACRTKCFTRCRHLEQRHQPIARSPCRARPRAGCACIRARRRGESARTGPCSTSWPSIHHRDAVGHLGDDAEVVRDEQQRQVEARLQLAHQVEHLRLNRDVERRRRLVGDDERRLAGERDGDHHALPHAAGQLVRVVADAPRRRRECAPRRAVRRRGARASARVAMPCTVSASAI